LASHPIGRLRSDGARRINVVAGGGKWYLAIGERPGVRIRRAQGYGLQ
jgi:hypothetical protein